jgi:hypothetical protein
MKSYGGEGIFLLVLLIPLSEYLYSRPSSLLMKSYGGDGIFLLVLLIPLSEYCTVHSAGYLPPMWNKDK